MNLYPNDLGKRVSWEVQQERSCALHVSKQDTQPIQAASFTVLCLAGACIFWALNILVVAIFFGLGTLLHSIKWADSILKSRNKASRLQRPVMDYELLAVRAKIGDRLVQSYLDLALSVVKLPPMTDEAADREVRDAMTALGIALEALPPEQPIVTDDPAALRAEAQAQIVHAQTETDDVISASLRRRAESLLRRADTSTRTLLLLRRNKALREEVGEQIKALGTSLTALQIGGRQSAPELSGLAASIHRVALEANAVTVARAEVDTLLSQPRSVTDTLESQEIRLSIGS
jgi:hypothetical protein